MQHKRKGKQTVFFENPPAVCSNASIVGDVENKGPLSCAFDMVLEDDTWGEKSWEKAECKMFEQVVRIALQKIDRTTDDIECLLGGDLLNQLITANYAARNLKIPFLGLYGACSTMTESLLIGSMLVDGGFARNVACVASSHFATAERQFRLPLEMGGQTQPTAQRTVTGAGCTIICAPDDALVNSATVRGIRVMGGTIGKVVDLGIKDASNMGAAMAPAACDTVCQHLEDTGRSIDDYDLVITGDLGKFGSQLLHDLCLERSVDISGKHADCGMVIFSPEQKFDCGGSGCGCSAVVLNSHYLQRLAKGNYRRILFMSTGALMSPSSSMQGESIPGIAHAIILERSQTP